jgi:hypothetical protein
MPENTEEISKPWAVYGWFLGPWGIGKVIRDSPGSLDIRYSEGQLYPAELWDAKWVRKFDSPIKAIAYYLVKNPGQTREEILKEFLQNFPSQESKLEKYLPEPTIQEESQDRLYGAQGRPVRRGTLEEIDMPHL